MRGFAHVQLELVAVLGKFQLPGTVGVQGDPCFSKPGHILAKGLWFHCLQEEPEEEEEEDEAWHGMAWPGRSCSFRETLI